MELFFSGVHHIWAGGHAVIRNSRRNIYRLLIAATAVFLLACVSHASAAPILSFEGLVLLGDPSQCMTSLHDEGCPGGGPCNCFVAIGGISGADGSGYSEVDLNQDDSSNSCADFNASIFIVASKDVQQADISGTWCKRGVNPLKGTYQTARSVSGLSGVGTVTGQYNPSSRRLILRLQPSRTQ